MTWKTICLTPDALGESPFWQPEEQKLYWLDIAGRKIQRCRLDGSAGESWSMPSGPGCMAPARRHGKSAGLIIALRDGIYRAHDWGGPLQCLVPAVHDPATTRFNDGKADPTGRFWAGTIYEPRDAREAVLYSLDIPSAGHPVLTQQAAGATVANGLAWSPDARTLYWGDTSTATVRAWDWDAQSNHLSSERVFKRWPLKPPGWKADAPDAASQPDYHGRPDGAAVDAEGNYYVAMYEGGRIHKLSPAGELLRDIPVPALCPTMPCFGGPELKTLFVTTARQNRPASELKMFPDSGCVFSMEVEVAGLPVNFFNDPVTA